MLLHDDDATTRPGLLARPGLTPTVAFVVLLIALIPSLFCVGYLLSALVLR